MNKFNKFNEVNCAKFSSFYADNSTKETAIEYGISIGTVGNWARKLELPYKTGLWKNLDIEFSEKQIQIIAGSMLGDGSLDKTTSRGKGIRNTTRISRFTECHGEKQSGWLKWKAKQLEPLPSKYFECYVTARKNLGNGKIIDDPTRKYVQCQLRTISYPIFTELEAIWYLRDEQGNYIFNTRGQRIKCLPSDFKITPLILAVFHMDDGCNQQHRKGINLSTLGFTYEEVCRLNDAINSLGFKCQVNYFKKDQFYLYIVEESYLDFLEMVRTTLPDIPKCMEYKVDISKYKLSWKKSKEYHPRSKLNDEIVNQIIEDAKAKVSQREIAKKYDIPFWTINRLLIGNTLYDTSLENTLNYRNTTGIAGVSYSKKRKRWTAKVVVDGVVMGLGQYVKKDHSVEVRRRANKMVKEGIKDKKLFLEMRKQFKDEFELHYQRT